MQILPFSATICCKAQLLNNNFNFNGLELSEDTFSSQKNTNQKAELTPNEKNKLRNTLRMCISQNDMEGLKSILEGEHASLNLFRLAKKYYDSECRMADIWYMHSNKPNPELGIYIHDILVDAELQKANGAKNIKNPYLFMINQIKYGNNKEQYAISMIKKAFKEKDSNILRIVIETLRHENKPYAEMLINAVSDKQKL